MEKKQLSKGSSSHIKSKEPKSHQKQDTGTTQKLPVKIGKAIARYRKLSKMTQAMVASELKIEVESVSRIETGFFSPSIERLEQFSFLFGCSISAFFRDESDEQDDLALTLADMIRPLKSQDCEILLSFVSDAISFIKGIHK